MIGDLLPTRLSTRLSQLPLLVTLRHDYRRFNQYLASFVKFNVCIIFLFIPEYIPPNLVKIHAQLKKWQAISVLNSAFSQLGLGLGLPLLVTTWDLARLEWFQQTWPPGCCGGVKKQKLNNSMPAICCNGSSVHPPNHYKNGYTVACTDMCFFCFDVLHSHLYNYDPPKSPSFTNEALWVIQQTIVNLCRNQVNVYRSNTTVKQRYFVNKQRQYSTSIMSMFKLKQCGNDFFCLL